MESVALAPLPPSARNAVRLCQGDDFRAKGGASMSFRVWARSQVLAGTRPSPALARALDS